MDRKELMALFHEMSGLDNVIGIGRGHKWVRGKDTGQDATLILVNKKYPRRDLTRDAIIPKRIGEDVTDVIEVGDVRFLSIERTGVQRPAHPGMSIGHYKVSAGTFGAIVRDRNNSEPLILSNNHVLANSTNGHDERAKPGDAILQPGLYDGGNIEGSVIGHLKRFVPLHSDVSVPRCKIAKAFEDILNKYVRLFQPQYRIKVLRESEQVNLVDCAVAAPVSPDMIAPDIVEVGVVAGIKEPQLGMAVKKSGRSSGLTYSMILATDVVIRVGVSNTESCVFADQILAGALSLPGDSGSLVLTEDNYAVGLLFAGSGHTTMFSRIATVFDELNITL